MRSKGTSYEAFIMFNVSFIGTCMKKDSMSKLTSRFVGRSRIFWIFYMKSIKLVTCDSDFPGYCSVYVRKQDKLYVGKCMALTIGLSEMFGLCTFGSPYSFGGRGYVGFNVDLVLLGMLLFSIRILVFCAIVLVGSLSFCMLCLRKSLHFFLIV